MGSIFKGLFGKKSVEVPTSDSDLQSEKVKLNEPLPLTESTFEIITNSEKEDKIKMPDLDKTDEVNTANKPKYDLRDYNYPTMGLFSAKNVDYLYSLKDSNTTYSLPIIFSVNNSQIVIKDLAELKCLFITGTQATGKTSIIHQLIISILLKKHPSQIKLVLADAKGIEFNIYRRLEKHFLAKLPGEESAIPEEYSQFVYTLNSLCIEIENRYELLKKAGTRNIKEYNEKFISRKLDPKNGHQFLPFIILVIDDLGGFSITSNTDINLSLQKLISDGYKAGIYSIISTSQFNGNSFSSNLLSVISQRIVFNLNSKEDYRRFFDTVKLKTHLAQGEFLYNEANEICIGNSIFFEVEEINNIINHIGSQRGYPEVFLLPRYLRESALNDFDLSERDSLFEDAARLIVQNQIGSTSLLQRRMKLGYNRAGILMEQLETAGIVGANQGSKARDVLIKSEIELHNLLENLL